MGRDFAAMGTEDGVKMRYGDGDGGPYPGPVNIRFVDRNTFLVIDNKNVISMQSLSGKVAGVLTPEAQRPDNHSEGEDDAVDDGFEKFGSKKTATRKVPEKFMNASPVNACAVPHSSNLALCDSKAQQLMFVNRRDFSNEGGAFGKEGIYEGEFRGISGIDLFTLGTQNICVICESKNHRVQIITEEGRHIATLGKGTPGMGKDQLYSPSSVAVFVDHHENNGLLDDPYEPRWYLGEADINTLEMQLANEYVPGHFFIGKRPNPHSDMPFSAFDMVYVTQRKRHLRVTIELLPGGGVVKREASIVDPTKYQSVLDLVMRSHHLVKESDKRPSCLIAVADTENVRVQVLRFFWIKSDVTVPMFQNVFTIGGLREQYCELKKPVCVAYSNTGELAVADAGLKAVLVMSQVMSVIRKIDLAFPPTYQVKMKMDLPDGKALRLANRQPVSVTFSPDGKIAVGYKSGGIVVHNAYKAFALGRLEKLTQLNFTLIMTYLNYRDAVNLRDCCWFLHNFTCKRRDAWLLHPMRQSHHHYGVYGFVKWCSLPNGEQKKFGEFVDENNKPVCMGYQEGTCTHQNSCPNRHCAIFLDDNLMDSSGACLDRKCFAIVLVRMFGANFFWKYELYIDELMIAYGLRSKLEIRGDPMSRHNETVRDRRIEETLTIGLKGYLEVMTTCEEVYAGQVVMHEHTLFSRQGKDRYRPMAEYNPDAVPIAWVDKLKQYTDRGIDVPWKVNKSRKFRVVGGMDAEVERGKGYTTKQQHIEVHRKESDKCIALMHNLFKALDSPSKQFKQSDTY